MSLEIPEEEKTATERLAALKAKSDRRKYEEKRDAAGFNFDGDYDTWTELEDLRRLTLDERRAAERAAEPKRASGGLTVAGSFGALGLNGHNYTINTNLLGSI